MNETFTLLSHFSLSLFHFFLLTFFSLLLSFFTLNFLSSFIFPPFLLHFPPFLLHFPPFLLHFCASYILSPCIINENSNLDCVLCSIVPTFGTKKRGVKNRPVLLLHLLSSFLPLLSRLCFPYATITSIHSPAS